MAETRQRLLDETGRLLSERSYNGFSYADLSSSLGIRKPSIHYHFPRKHDLVSEVIRGYAHGFVGWMGQQAGRSCPEQLHAYFDLFEGFVRQGRSCPTATLVAEWGTLPESVAVELTRLMNTQVDWLTGVLERGREREQFHFVGVAAELARLVASTVQGAMLSARALGLPVYLQIVGQLSSLIRTAA